MFFNQFNSMANLQTSLNKEDGVGVNSLTSIYIAKIASSMFFTDFIVSRLGCKWAIAAGMAGYTLYMAANFYAVNYTMIPAGVILGLASAPLFSAQSTYLTQLGIWYAKITQQKQNGVINSFFGIFFTCLQSTDIWGNLVSSLVFAPTHTNTSSSTTQCGAAFCPDTSGNSSSNFQQETEKVYTVCGIYLSCAVSGVVIISVFLDDMLLDKSPTEEQRHLSPRLLISTFKHLFTSPIQMLLVPITMYRGVEAAFMAGDFTKSFVSCSLGIWNLGYVMICYGVVNALSSFTSGRLVKYVGQLPFFVIAFAFHIGLQIFLLQWKPSSDEVAYFYISAALWGVGNAIFQTQSNALYGCLFTDSLGPAFANHRLWESIGYAMAYAYSDLLCTYVKLYLCVCLLSLSILGYLTVEFMLRMRTKSKHVNEVIA